MTRKFWIDLIERVVMTALQAGAAAWLVTGDLDLESLKIAGVAALVAAAKCIIAANIGNRDSASVAPTV